MVTFDNKDTSLAGTGDIVGFGTKARKSCDKSSNNYRAPAASSGFSARRTNTYSSPPAAYVYVTSTPYMSEALGSSASPAYSRPHPA
jgi:hypothetical protein